MKYLLSALLCLIAANAFASKPDSGICPWKMPFTISIKANGVLHKYSDSSNRVTDYGYSPATDSFNIYIDTSTTFIQDVFPPVNVSLQYFLHDNTLEYNLSYDDTVYGWKKHVDMTFSIIFVPGVDSISSLNYTLNTNSLDISGNESSTEISFRIKSIPYIDSSIETPDTSFSNHKISFSDFESNTYFKVNSQYEDFTATSVTLSGLFSTTTFSDPSAIVTAPQPSGSLSIVNTNGSISCSFTESEYERNLEVYSPLGIKVASITIPAAENNTALPRLRSGIYFARLEGDVRKIYIP